MNSSRRTFLKRFGVGSLGASSLLANGLRAESPCQRVSGSGSYLVGPFEPVEGTEPVFLVTDLGFDETMVYCTIRTNYAAIHFKTATMGMVDLGAHEFFMDMQSVRINSVEVQEGDTGPRAVYSGILRSETRLFSGDKMKTLIEGHATFGCYATQLNPKSNIAISKTNFSMTMNFDPKGEHAAIFGANPTFAGHLTRGNIVVVS